MKETKEVMEALATTAHQVLPQINPHRAKAKEPSNN